MAKIRIILLGLLVIYPAFLCNLEGNCITDVASLYVGITEKTGNNDGEFIEYIQKHGKAPKNSSYCALYVKYVLDSCGVYNSITAWSPTAFNKKNIVYFKSKFEKEPKEGDVFVIYSVSKKRIAHTGFFDKKLNSKLYYTIEANTSANAAVGSLQDANGDGIYRKIRSFNATYGISRW